MSIMLGVVVGESFSSKRMLANLDRLLFHVNVSSSSLKLSVWGFLELQMISNSPCSFVTTEG